MGLDDFEVLQPIGKGAFARVDKVKRKADGKVYALKRVDIAAIPQKDLQDSLNEIRILASFKHPRLIRWYETFIAEGGSSELCIVMEYCPYGDLEQKIKRHQHRKQYIDEREIWVYAINILEGLAALHSKGVVHRDLKPANCLIDPQGCVKIADMNISKVSKGGNMQVGTPYFICPEIYLKRPYSSTSDMWSLGGVLYNLAALHPPFLADNIQNLRKAVVKGTYDPLPPVYGASLGTLIGRLLQLNPADRPEAKDVLADPLIERHRYLLLHPLPQGAQEAEGEMLPTIKIASDKEGVKTIALPGPAYDDNAGASTPRSPSSVVVVYSPRAAAAAAAKEKDGTAAAAVPAPAVPTLASPPKAPTPKPSAKPPTTALPPAIIDTAKQRSPANSNYALPTSISLSRDPTPPPPEEDGGRAARPTSLPFGGLNFKDFKAPAFKSPFAAPAPAQPATAGAATAGADTMAPAPAQEQAQQPQRKSLPFSLAPLSPSHHNQPPPEVASDGFLAGSEQTQPLQQQDQAGGNKRSSIRRILDDMEQRRLSGFISGSGGAASPPPSSGGGGGSNLADDMKRLFTRSPTGAGATAAPPTAAEGAPVSAMGSGVGMKWPSLSPKAKHGGL